MAKIEKVKQSVFGRTLGAELHAVKVRPVDMAAPLERGLSQFVQGATSLVNTISHLKEEEANAALEQAQADYLQEVTEGLNKEVYSLHGEALHGAEDRARKIQLDALNRQREKLSRYGAEAGRKFSLFAQRNSTGETSRVVHYAAGEIRRATGEAAKSIQASSFNTYKISGDDASREAYMEAFNKEFQVRNGRLVDDAKLAKLKEDVGKGILTIRGENLRIVDEVKEGDKGVIGKAAATDLVERFTRENAAYRQEMEQAVDALHAGRVHYLLQNKMYKDAQFYLENRAEGLSDRTRTALGISIKRESDREAAVLDAGEWIQKMNQTQAGNDALSMGGKLYTAAWDKACLEALAVQQKKAQKDPFGVETVKYNAMLNQYQQTKALKQAFNHAEKGRITDKLMRDGMYKLGNEGALVNAIGALPGDNNHIKEELMYDAISRKVRADKRLASTPAAKRGKDSRRLELIRLAGDGGHAAVGAKVYNLGNPAERKEYLQNSEFSAAEQQEILKAVDAPFPLSLITQMTADELNNILGLKEGDKRFTASAVNYLAPELVQELSRILGYDARTADRARKGNLSKEEKTMVQGAIRRLLRSREASKHGWLYGFNKVSLPEFLYEGLREEGEQHDLAGGYAAFCRLAMSPEQVKAWEQAVQVYRRTVEPAKAGEDADALRSSRRSPGDVPVGLGAKRQGRKYDSETGMYYTREEWARINAERKRKADEEQANIDKVNRLRSDDLNITKSISGMGGY